MNRNTRRPLRVVLISTLAPTRGNLVEFNTTLANALAASPEIGKLDILACRAEGAPAEERWSDTVTVRRVWDLNRSLSILALAFKARKLDPDVVHVSAAIRSWGEGRVASFAGAFLVLLLRLMTKRVVLTMHTVGNSVSLDRLAMKLSLVTRLGMSLAERLYLTASLVVVTLDSIKQALERRFGVKNVVHVPFGSYGARVSTASPGGNRALAFGYWGPYKDPEMLISAAEELRAEGVDIELTLGGGPHPYAKETYAAIVERYRDSKFVRLTGYVPEAELPELFASATVIVLPYRTNAGCSGSIMWGRSHAKPLIISNDDALLEQVRDEGGECVVFDDKAGLKEALRRVLSDVELQRRMGERNLAVAKKLSLAVHFERVISLYRTPPAPELPPLALDHGIAEPVSKTQ